MLKKALIASSILLSSAAFAEGGYIGVSVGQTDLDVSGFDDGDSLAFAAGYRINENFALEASYLDLGDSEDDIDPVWTVESDGFNFAVVGIIPVGEMVEIFGKAGVLMWDLSVSEAGYGEFYSEDGNDISLGFGATVNFTKQFAMVFEYQSFEIDDEDVSNISLGARLNF